MSEDHECRYPEVIIGKDDEDGVLHEGDKVLAPCPDCGETPLDHLEFMETHRKELEAAVAQLEPHRPLYHWSPRARRGQIIRYGLRPGSRPTTSTGVWRAGHVCFADSPSWAWALSGGMDWAPKGEWDLWQTSLDRFKPEFVTILPTDSRPSGIYEVRVEARVFKRDLWHVGTRYKE